MKKTRILGITAAALLTLGTLTGCAVNPTGESGISRVEDGGTTTPSDHYTFYQKLPGGKRVLCVWADEAHHIGGLSCDFDHIEVLVGGSRTSDDDYTPVPLTTEAPTAP